MEDLEERKKALVKELKDSGVLKSEKVEEALLNVPRHLFVPERYRRSAYINQPLPTFKGQTISQPYVVVWMTEALEPKKGEKVLEIGTGSGWQATILEKIVKPGNVYTIELEPELVKFAKENINKIGIENIEIIQGNGSKGLPDKCPFDKIILTAAGKEIPKPLLKQLKTGGKLIAPVGKRYSQRLIIVEKKGENKFKREDLGGVIFVPLR